MEPDDRLRRVLSRPGCPICGEPTGGWTLLAQVAHVRLDHSWAERIKLRWHTRTPLRDLLINRKYGDLRYREEWRP